MAVQLSLLRGSRPKPAKTSPRECAQSTPDFFQIRFTFGGVIAERMNTAQTRRKVNPIFG